jgi:hypothetical protein
MGKPTDRDVNYMHSMWGTVSLISDYNSTEIIKEKKMLREIANDDKTPKKYDFEVQNELHEKIRNDEDYDDWSYGTEPSWGHKW